MDKWSETASRLWLAILTRTQDLKAEGETLQSIADRVGVKSRTIIHYWLSGMRKADSASFADLMSYAERLGIDYRHYFPGGEPPAQETAPACSTCKKLLAKDRENQKLQREVERLRQELAEEKTRSKTLDGVIDKLVTSANGGQAGRQDLRPVERKATG